MNIEKIVVEITDYFKSKILNGEYQFISCDETTAKILIDKKYTIDVWIANEPIKDFAIWDVMIFKKSTMNDFKFKSEKERLQGWEHIKPLVKSYRDEIFEKQKKINELKKEIEFIENNTIYTPFVTITNLI